jgi:predicted TIM-barrel fold metal-dependent hydrolase
MTAPVPGTQEWLDLVVEDVVEPDLPIIDPHHHLWPVGGALPYGPAELAADAASGHRVVHTVFMECHAAYRPDGPEHLRVLGETEFVTAAALADPDRLIGALVAHADLRREDLDEILDAHVELSQGLFRGIRDALSSAEHPEILAIPGRAPKGLYADPAFRRGVARLGERGFTYDSWHYHHQNREFLELARAAPGTTMVLDHFGTPLGVGPYADRREEIFEQWKLDIADIAACPNTVAKLGGLAMIDNGFGWHTADRPPTSDEFLAVQRRWYLHAIECFGPERCMFESNFPVDRFSLSYRTLWNAFKRLTAEFSADERTAMFSGTAARIYRVAR